MEELRIKNIEDKLERIKNGEPLVLTRDEKNYYVKNYVAKRRTAFARRYLHPTTTMIDKKVKELRTLTEDDFNKACEEAFPKETYTQTSIF